MFNLPAPHDIRYFVEIAETLNFSRAADRLGVRQPTLSLAVKRLEEALEVELFVRGKQGVQLTHAGRRFLSESRQLIEQWHELRQLTQRADVEVSGRYLLGAHPSVALTAMPQLLPRLLETFRDLELQLVHDHSRNITDAVIALRVDFGIVVNPRHHPDLTIIHLYDDEFALWSAREATALQDIKDAVLITDPQLGQSQALMKLLAKRKVTFKRTVESSDLELIASLTASGTGIGLLPARVAERNRGLVRLASALPTVRDRHCLVFRTDAQRSPGSRVLTRHLVQWIRGTAKDS